MDRPWNVAFALAVLGCRTNQEEGDALRSHLLALGAEEARFPEPAALVVVNTCAVTATALAQSRQAIRRAARLAGPGCWIVVTGCGAQLDPRALAALPGVGLVVGNAEKSALPRLFASLAGCPLPPGEGRLSAAASAAGLALERAPGGVWFSWSSDPGRGEFLTRSGIPGGRLRPPLKIQDGCDRACGYCVVAGLRGRPRSKPVEAVLAEARWLIAAGTREIVLTGINLGLYQEAGAPPAAGPGSGLARLLERLLRLPDLGRIRLSSLEPDTIGPQLVDLLAGEERLCPHLHLALQSGDDGVLETMGRRYRRDDVRRIAGRLLAARPQAALGVDVIAGYPGESEEAFSGTIDLLESLPAAYLHAFGYSERPGTPARHLAGRVHSAVVRKRVGRLRLLDSRLRQAHQARLAGSRCAVVVERCSGEAFEGMSGEYVRMRGEGAGIERGSLVQVVALPPSGETWQPCVPAGA